MIPMPVMGATQIIIGYGDSSVLKDCTKVLPAVTRITDDVTYVIIKFATENSLYSFHEVYI